MKCSYCINEPQFKCACKEPYMCLTHLGEHIVNRRGHNFEHLDLSLTDSRLRHLHLKIQETLSTLSQAKIYLLQQAKLLIDSINTVTKASIQKIDLVRKEYLQNINKTKFCESEMPKLEEIEKTSIIFKPLNINDIKSQINQVFSRNIENKTIVRSKLELL